MKAMNRLRSVTAFSWGADTEIGMRLYKAVIRPKIDYGCIVYGAASETSLRSLDVVANEAMRITSGAFKTTPVSSMQIMNSEAPLELQRAELLMKYYYKPRCHLQNPAYGCVINDILLNFLTRPRIKNPLIVRIQQTLQVYKTPIQPVLTFKTPDVYSHNLRLPQIDLDVLSMRKN